LSVSLDCPSDCPALFSNVYLSVSLDCTSDCPLLFSNVYLSCVLCALFCQTLENNKGQSDVQSRETDK
jgi:hypothetical protein